MGEQWMPHSAQSFVEAATDIHVKFYHRQREMYKQNESCSAKNNKFTKKEIMQKRLIVKLTKMVLVPVTTLRLKILSKTVLST